MAPSGQVEQAPLVSQTAGMPNDLLNCDVVADLEPREEIAEPVAQGEMALRLQQANRHGRELFGYGRNVKDRVRGDRNPLLQIGKAKPLLEDRFTVLIDPDCATRSRRIDPAKQVVDEIVRWHDLRFLMHPERFP